MRRLLGSIIVAFCLFVVPASPAQASGIAVLRDCQAHGTLRGHYSQKDYRDALANMPADLDEYSDCRSVIETAQANAAHPSSKPHGGSKNAVAASAGGAQSPDHTDFSDPGSDGQQGAATTASAGDLAAIGRATRARGSLVLPSGAVRPGAASTLTGGELRSLPVTLRIVLVLLVAGAAAGAALGVWRRVIARRRQS